MTKKGFIVSMMLLFVGVSMQAQSVATEQGNIPYNQGGTSGIQPTIRTIEADGTSRYFDLQGRMLDGTPVKGLYINNGKKVIR